MAIVFHGNNGEFLNGVPARDLKDEEFLALDAETRETVRASTLYDTREAPAEPAPQAPASEKAHSSAR